MTGFVGREGELAQLASLISSYRLVTVTGPGGVGKTRLALRAVRQAAGEYPHGVVVAELSGLGDPGLLHNAVASALGLVQQDSRPPLEAITGFLKERELLLVLDTCEHLIGECALLAEAVLRAAPGVRILATSRQPLDTAGESILPLGPLPVPDADEPQARDDQAQGEPARGDAVDLFEQRAVAAAPGFAVTAENQGAVARVCRLLDGIPLAIELAAVRLRVLHIDELTRQLEAHRLRVLAAARRGTAARHQSLDTVIAWSHELCTPAEQALWARLSMFAGPFSLSAAREVCAGGGLPRDAILSTIVGLVDKSVLLRVDGSRDRYRMLDTIREFGAGQLALASTGTPDEIRGKMLRYYLARAQEFDADPVTDQLARYQALCAEHDSIRAALSFGLSVPGADRTAARLATSLFWFWLIGGFIAEGEHWLDRVLDRFPGPSAEHASALVLRATAIAALGDPATGVRDCEQGLAMARKLGAARTYARGHMYYCLALVGEGRSEDTIAAAARAADLMRAAGDARAADVLPLYVAMACLLAGDLDRALAACTEGLRLIPAERGELWATGFLSCLAGIAQCLKGELEEGSGLLRTALSMKMELGDIMGTGYCLAGLAIAAAGQSRFGRAAWLLGTAAPIWERLGSGAFTGAPGLIPLVEFTTGTARAELGADRYDELVRAVAQRPQDEAVALAIADADELPSSSATITSRTS